jgi:tRNA threonylcarbamoyladenosine biosynthesis protein TsaB
MIDARRMEVYTCLFDYRLHRINDIEAMVVESDSFSDILDGHKLFVFGDGADKCKDILTRKNAVFFDHINPSASGLVEPGYKKFQNKDFVDLAYFEPFYLKDFVAGKPKVKGL